MGESIAEGTIVRWIKKVGDTVDRDEPLFEISTDKVDAEIPSPAAGVLADIAVKEGETVPVNSVVATIGAAGERLDLQTAAEPPPVAEPQPDGSPSPLRPAHTERAPGAPPLRTPAHTERAPGAPPLQRPAAASGQTGVAAPDEEVRKAPAAPRPGVEASAGEGASVEEQRRAKSSPLVRKIAKEHDVDLRRVPGSGIGGRVTKHDILGYIEGRSERDGAPPAEKAPLPGAHVPAFRPGEPVEIVPLSVMRRKIAEHMVLSRRTSAHVHSVFEVNFSRVAQLREQKKAEYERAGAKLTYMSFITKAVVDALRAMPIVNASLEDNNIVYKKDINIGIAVALDWGLIVPVVKNADEKNLLGISRAIADVAARARSKQLKPEDVQGGTFTITNPGTFGAQFGMPIINQPQVAILGVGAIEKRAIVIDDAIAIRPMAYLTLGYDHRLIDGAVGDQFMSLVKRGIEQFDGDTSQLKTEH
jgi:2-oxoglutarate dehydrogenase E2 component (dihydrolipoamide succinyltransferase)